MTAHDDAMPDDISDAEAFSDVDFDQAAADYHLHARALTRCMAAAPHLDTDDAPPCSGCLLATAKRLAIPPAHVSTAAAASFSLDRRRAEGATGVVGPHGDPTLHRKSPVAGGVTGLGIGAACASQAPAAPPSTNNRSVARNDGPAESGPARPQKQV